MSNFLDDDIILNDPSPDYNVAISRSNTGTSTTPSHVHWHSIRSTVLATPPKSAVISELPTYSPINEGILRTHSAASRRLPLPTTRPERSLYAYSLRTNSASFKFYISVEPVTGQPFRGKYLFRLSLKVDKVERQLQPPINLSLTIDPRQLEFIVFAYPGKSSTPADSLYSYRVWLRANGVDHRLFGDDELWIGQDLDFSMIADASFARLRPAPSESNRQMYDAVVGRARVHFIIRWRCVGEKTFKFTIEYEAGGVSSMLTDDLSLTLSGDPRKLGFLIYSVPMASAPEGASHRLRIWLKTYVLRNDANSIPFNDSFVYQRIWKSDSFKIGSQLNFSSLGTKMIMGKSNGAPLILPMSSTATAPVTSRKNADIS